MTFRLSLFTALALLSSCTPRAPSLAAVPATKPANTAVMNAEAEPAPKKQNVPAAAPALDLSKVSFEQAMLKMAASESSDHNSAFFHQWITQNAAEVTPPQAAKLAFVLIHGFVPGEGFGQPETGADND